MKNKRFTYILIRYIDLLNTIMHQGHTHTLWTQKNQEMAT